MTSSPRSRWQVWGERAAWAEETLIAYLLAAMTTVAFVNVVARRVFASSFVWALELTLNLFLYFVLFGMAYGLRKGLHASVDVLTSKLAPRAQRWSKLSVWLLVIVYSVTLSASGFYVAEIFLSHPFLREVGSEELNIPHWVTYGLLGLSFGYFSLTACVLALIELRRA